MKRPNEETLNAAFNAANERRPTLKSLGLFAYSDAPPMVCGSGIGAFSWFDTKLDMINFVAESLAWWHPAPSYMEPDEIATGVKAIMEEVDPTTADLEQLRSGLNEFMRNMWQMRWPTRSRSYVNRLMNSRQRSARGSSGHRGEDQPGYADY